MVETPCVYRDYERRKRRSCGQFLYHGKIEEDSDKSRISSRVISRVASSSLSMLSCDPVVFCSTRFQAISIGGSISSEGFLSSILLSMFPLFATGGSLGLVFLLGLSAFAMVAAYASRAAVNGILINISSTRSKNDITSFERYNGWKTEIMMQMMGDDNVIKEENGKRIRFLGGNSSSGTKKYRGSNSSDGGNTGDGVKIAGRVIGSGDEIEFSEELKELPFDEAEKIIR
ncbi:hypothetical protein Tco_0196214 [Tanacetum coccineum]